MEGSRKQRKERAAGAEGVGGEAIPMETQSEQGEAPVEEYKNRVFEAQGYGECKAEFYRNKSYIRHKNAEGKLAMVVGCAFGQDHKRVVAALISHVQQGKSRAELLDVREQILSGQHAV